jgi:hypothetical protein
MHVSSRGAQQLQPKFLAMRQVRRAGVVVAGEWTVKSAMLTGIRTHAPTDQMVGVGKPAASLTRHHCEARLLYRSLLGDLDRLDPPGAVCARGKGGGADGRISRSEGLGIWHLTGCDRLCGTSPCPCVCAPCMASRALYPCSMLHAAPSLVLRPAPPPHAHPPAVLPSRHATQGTGWTVSSSTLPR